MLTFDDMKNNINILLVDDDADYIDLVKMYFGALGYNIDIVNSGAEAIDIVKQEKHQIILMDYFMPAMSGEEVVNEIRKFNQQVIIIMQTGFAGQKPPIDTMKRLNIQNFHDKTEGVEKLNLVLISAVKIFQQQNAISVTKFKSNAISRLISSIASNIKQSLTSISGSVEITNMIISDSLKDEENKNKLKMYYQSNKSNLEKVDKVLTTIIKEVNNDSLDVMLDSDIMDIINAIVENELKEKAITLNTNVSLRANSYITGSVNDIIFIICEIISRIAKVTNEKNISLILTEDESKWYFKIENDSIKDIDNNNLYVLKNVIVSIERAEIEVNQRDIIISILKK